MYGPLHSDDSFVNIVFSRGGELLLFTESMGVGLYINTPAGENK